MVNEVFKGNAYRFMKDLPDGHFDLAIVDPYRLIPQKDKAKFSRHMRKQPSAQYFNQLFRVSRMQIIFGAQNCTHLWPHIGNKQAGWYVWDQMEPIQALKGQFTTGLMAWCSMHQDTIIIPFMWMDKGRVHGHSFYTGNTQATDPEIKETIIHPFQIPIEIYRGLMQLHGKKGFKILDTHVGSGSSRIAADMCGFDYTGYEIDATCYGKQQDRWNTHKNKPELPLQWS